MTTSTDSAQLSSYIFGVLEAGKFNSTVEEFLDSTFRGDDPDTFYARTLREEGKEAAEQQLIELAKTRWSDRVADALAPIVAAIAQLATVQHRNVKVRSFVKTDDSFFPFPYRSSRNTFAIAVTNPEIPGCGCNQPKGSDKFGRYGELGITSYVVVIDPADSEHNCVVLMLPIRKDRDSETPSNGFVSLVMGRNGRMASARKEVYLYRDSAEHLAFGGEGGMGMSSAEGGAPCQYVGFPGAQEFITSSLHELPEYLEHAALELSGEHQH